MRPRTAVPGKGLGCAPVKATRVPAAATKRFSAAHAGKPAHSAGAAWTLAVFLVTSADIRPGPGGTVKNGSAGRRSAGILTDSP